MNIASMSRQRLEAELIGRRYEKRQLEPLTTHQLRERLALEIALHPFGYF
jgi:hypothetical protein